MVTLTLLHPQEHTSLKEWHFEDETLIRIGRALENHVVLSHSVVSRFHLELRKVDLPNSATSNAQPLPVWQLINHSVNGTFIEGQAVAQELITNGTLIQLAFEGPILRFQTVASSVPIPEHSVEQATSETTVPNQALSQQSAPTRCTHTGNPTENLFCIHCGQPVQVEKTIRHYQVLRVLGRGGMGTTYLVWKPTTTPKLGRPPQGNLQVLKEMNADIAQIPKAQELFVREARTLKSLSHPGIPQYYDFFIEEDKKYLVMELVHGQDLEQQVRQNGSVLPEQAIHWMIQVCEVLDYLHSRPVPIIHRDIKPGNLLVRTVDNRIVVLDFGAVKALGMPAGTRIGAEGYSAPEQVQGRAVIQSDLYAIGPCLVFLLAAASPQRFYRKRGQTFRFSLEGVEDIPRNLQLLIQRVTEPQPSNRYQSAKELIQALKNCLIGL